MEIIGIKLAVCPTKDDYIGCTLEAWKRFTYARVKISQRVVALLLLEKLGSRAVYHRIDRQWTGSFNLKHEFGVAKLCANGKQIRRLLLANFANAFSASIESSLRGMVYRFRSLPASQNTSI